MTNDFMFCLKTGNGRGTSGKDEFEKYLTWLGSSFHTFGPENLIDYSHLIVRYCPGFIEIFDLVRISDVHVLTCSLKISLMGEGMVLRTYFCMSLATSR